MKIASCEISRKIDSYCINNLGIPGIVLMENAVLKVIDNIDLNNYHNFVVVCGSGNNGGDGLGVARHLYTLNKNVKVFLIGSSKKLSNDCKVNYEILKNMKVNITKVENIEDVTNLRDAINKSDMVIDSIFGTGITRDVAGVYDSVISIINENSKYTLSIDVPSGLNGDTGEVQGNCIKANKTVSFQLYKEGFLNYGTDKFTGKIVVTSIGIPEKVIDKFYEKKFIIEEKNIKENLIKRKKYGHKGTYGKVLIVSGSKGFSGAPYICTEAAVKSGSGLVNLVCHKDIYEVVASKLVEAMVFTYEDSIVESLIEKSNSIAIGPGMGNNSYTKGFLEKIIKKSNCPLIIDADGINALKDNLDILKKAKSDIILTPHFGEFSRITGYSIEDISKNRLKLAKEFANKYGVILLLKGYNTIITDGESLIINSTGSSAMASGGMGDCLTGMITSFIGQGYSSMKAAYLAAYIHGYTGDKLAKSMFSVSASDVLKEIPISIKEFQYK
ncbi:NAD(P)H-hydrate dehydratase [Clostridium oceanicum]|uniref:Bifunctional NAD(P)H-hydrate repair enzyme n=1 Tax=Clostridium oceanicum TaxID=1543 RepID=A0ABP3UJU2_9CLOT